MMKKELNYKFIPVPQKLYKVLDNNCRIVLTVMIELDSVFSDSNGWFYRSNTDLIEQTKLSKNLLNAVLVTLNRNNLIEVKKPNRNVNTNSYRINFNEINRYDSITFEDLKNFEIKTLNYKDSTFKVSFTEVHTVNTSKDNSSLREHSEVHTVNTRSSHSEHNNIYYNIDNNNIYNNNIGPNNNNILYSVHTVNNGVNCFISDEELDEYVKSSEAFNIESETGNNRDNLNSVNSETNIDNNISTVNSDNNTANAESGNNKLDNSNEVNTAVLSPSNSSNEESVISTKKSSENGLKQAKTRELGIVNKTDNSNEVISNTANAESGNNKLDNSNECNLNKLEGNKETVNSNNVIPNNKLDNSNNVIHKEKELEENKLDNLNNVIHKEKELEENKTDNSNEGIDNTIAEGDNPTAYAVSEFRDKCTKYTIILEGKETEIDQPIEEYIRCYYNRIMNTIYNTNDFNKKRKIFNRMLKDNNLNGQHYDEMSDKLDVRYSRYVELDKESKSNEQNDKEEFSQEDLQIIASELLNQCLNFKLTRENNMQDFYKLRAQYSGFVELYDLKKEGLKLQEKFAELSAANKALNSPAFAN